MLWLEMSRDEAHGGGSWAFGQSLWSPSRKTNRTKWAIWETLLHVETDDPVLHLRGRGDRATFVAFSTAAADGFETSDRPPSPGAWSYARSFYRVPLRDFTPLADPMLLRDIFRRRDAELRSYFIGNKAASRKERLFYVIQAGRLQCLNGAYLSEVSRELARLLLDRTEDMPQHSLQRRAKTLTRVRSWKHESLLRRPQTEDSRRPQARHL